MEPINNSSYKWLPNEIEQKLNLKRTSLSVGNSFERAQGIYETQFPGVYLTQADSLRDLETLNLWKIEGKGRQKFLTGEMLHDVTSGVFQSLLSEVIR